ncbi:hypothetical protein WMF39_01500 [Sorangium sp. So ce1504]|uniref:hypothetical protein n=1 Tax=Sorangium sp. So ce1504 TaxID=3133337 RepID=UPI003F61DBA2
MKLGLLEDGALYQLAGEVVPEGGSGVDNAQITGLLSTVRASGSCGQLREMAQRQLEKARKDGDRGAARAGFYDRLFRALQEVEKLADAYARAHPPEALQGAGKIPAKQWKDRWSGHLAVTLMTHVAAEHRWRGSRR